MKKKLLGVTFAATLIMGLAGATPASARCGRHAHRDVHGWSGHRFRCELLTGQTTATTRYNAVNPFGEVCTVHP